MGPPSKTGGEKNYYLDHRAELLQAFQATNNGARQYLAARDGEKLALAVTREAASRFSSLLPRLPDVGGEQNIDIQYLPIAAWYLALYRPMQAHGKSAADVGISTKPFPQSTIYERCWLGANKLHSSEVSRL